jgi:hypothetical protein
MSDCNRSDSCNCNEGCEGNCTCNEDKEWSKIFWDPKFEGDCRGGLYFRSMKLGQFIKETEEKGFKIVGIKFDESNNCDIIFVPLDEEE